MIARLVTILKKALFSPSLFNLSPIEDGAIGGVDVTIGLSLSNKSTQRERKLLTNDLRLAVTAQGGDLVGQQ